MNERIFKDLPESLTQHNTIVPTAEERELLISEHANIDMYIAKMIYFYRMYKATQTELDVYKGFDTYMHLMEDKIEKLEEENHELRMTIREYEKQEDAEEYEDCARNAAIDMARYERDIK